MTKSALPEVSSGSFSATLAQHVLDLLDWHGQSSAAILAAAGLTPECFAAYNGWVPAAIGQKVLHAALELSQDPFLFLKLSKNTFHAGYGMVGQVVQACPTLKDVILAVARFEPLISDIGISSLEHEPGKVVWGFECRSEDPVLVHHIAEFITGCRYFLLLMVREKRSNIVMAVHFRHAAPENPADMDKYADVFHCPVYFDQPETALILTPQSLSMPLRQVDSSLKDVLEEQAEKKLEAHQVTVASLLAQAKAQLRILLQNGHPSRDLLAERLGVSSRHLCRQLQSEGSSYRDLLDELRLEVSQKHLLESGRTVDEIGRLLSFSDGQSFIRWFRQMTGHTPGDFRLQRSSAP